MQMLHFRVPTSCNGMRLNIFLRTMGVSSACIKAVKYQGTGFCVRLGDEVIPVHTDYRVATAQIVSFALPPEPPTDVQPEPLPIDVIYEDEFAAVLNKPAGIAVHQRDPCERLAVPPEMPRRGWRIPPGQPH